MPLQSTTYTQSSLPSACTVPDTLLQFSGGGGGWLANPNFCPISINFDNQLQSQSFDSYTLYKIAVKNGITCNMSEFVGMPQQGAGSTGKGMCIKLFFGSDITLNEGTYVGMNGRYNFTVQATVYNQTAFTVLSPELHATVVYDGFSTTSETLQTKNL